MDALVSYADTKGVGLTFWYNSGGRHNVVTEQPRNLMDDRARRRAEFARLQALGVRGVKVDFLQSDKQDIVRLYLDILEDAAEHHLLVDFHGCTIPRGWERTWPNLMTMEAVPGAEFYSFPSEPDYGAIAPRQNAIHPFLRNVVGSMDYTPVLFSQFDVRRRTTNAHEAALAVLFESGLLHMADSAASYRALPETTKPISAICPQSGTKHACSPARPENMRFSHAAGAGDGGSPGSTEKMLQRQSRSTFQAYPASRAKHSSSMTAMVSPLAASRLGRRETIALK